MPIQALKADVVASGGTNVATRFTGQCALLYTAWCVGDGEHHGSDGPGGSVSARYGIAVVGDNGDAAYVGAAYENGGIFGVGNAGASHAAGFNSSGDCGFADVSIGACGVSFGPVADMRIGGWLFASDLLQYKIGQLLLPEDMSDVVVTDLDFDGEEPSAVILIRQLSESGGDLDDIVHGVGVWTPGGEWFNGYYVPAIFGNHDGIVEMWDDGCAIHQSRTGDGDVLRWNLTPDADGFTLSAGPGTLPADAADTWYGYLAIYDPAAEFDAGVATATDGAVTSVGGFSAPDALFVSRSNRELGEEKNGDHDTVDSPFPYWGQGSSDRYAPVPASFSLSGDDPDATFVIGLRVDEATGDGWYFIYVPAGDVVAIVVYDGGSPSILDSGSLGGPLSVGDEISLICDGDDISVDLNGSTILSGTDSSVPGPGRPAVVCQSIEGSWCGTIGAPEVLDLFQRAANVDANTGWEAFVNAPLLFGTITANMSVALGKLLAFAADQASVWTDDSFTDAEFKVVVGELVATVPPDFAHNVWSHYACCWNGGVKHNEMVMGGDPLDTLIQEVNQLGVVGSTTEYKLDLDVARASGWGVTASGWQADAVGDTGNHQVAWLLGKVGPSASAAVCGFPEGGRQMIYRRGV